MLPDGVELNVTTGSGKKYAVQWTAPAVNFEVDDKVVDAIRSSVSTLSVSANAGESGLSSHLMSVVDMNLSEDDSLQLSFPCILVQARFDPFTIVHAPQMFSVVSVYSIFEDCASNVSGDTVPSYCAQEVWDLCRASEHTPSGTLSGFEEDGACKPNMIIPLAHTLLLFSLYVERGRAFHSAINVTGDCLALSQVSVQWPKMFLDSLLLPRNHPAKREWIEVGLKSLVSFSYAVDAHVVSPSKDAVVAMFEGGVSVIPRDVDKSGLTCSYALCSILATRGVKFTAANWNKIVITMYSRLAETIAGTKNVRHASNRHPGELEEAYRLHLGALQGAVRKRLHVEWTKASLAEKMEAVGENPEVVRALLVTVCDEYLAKLGEYFLPLWSVMVGAVQDALYLCELGVEGLRSIYQSCGSLADVHSRLCATSPPIQPFSLPVVCAVPNGSGLIMREVGVGDLEHMVMYIDALVATKASPKVEYKPVLNPTYPTFSSSQNRELDVKLAQTPWDAALPVANVAFIGNVNSGKSSIGGRLLEDLHMVDQRSVDKLGAQAEKLGYTNDLKHAWLMDKRASERAGGFTIDPKWNAFQTPSRRFTMIDNPGHKDFVRNTSTGVFHADTIVLVVSAVLSELNLAEMSRSQAEEHLLCAFCFGIKSVIVVVNKMDLVGFDRAAFEEVQQRTLKKVKKAGFKIDNISVIPVSALSGEGLMSSSANMPWYEGPCLLQALDEVTLPKRQTEKTFRMVVDEVFKVGGVGTVVCGKVERGRLKEGDAVSVYPNGPVNVRVRSMEAHHNSVDTAFPGDDIGITLTAKVRSSEYHRGMIIGLASNPPVPSMARFEAQIFLTKAIQFKVGYCPSIICHLETLSVRITRLVSIIDRNNAVVDSNPTEVKMGQICICEVEALKPFVGETIHEAPRLSRFLVRENRLIVAMGFIRAALP
jgi:elongation factor 1-alpha